MTTKTGAGAAINPDNINMFRFIIVGVLLTFLVSVGISSFGLYDVGIKQGLPPFLAWLTPAMFDVPILIFTGAALIQKRRGRRFARGLASASVGFFTASSSMLNLLHSLDSGYAPSAVYVNTLAPLVIFLSTETLVLLITKTAPVARQRKPAAKKATARAKAPKQAPTAAPAQVPSFETAVAS